MELRRLAAEYGDEYGYNSRGYHRRSKEVNECWMRYTRLCRDNNVTPVYAGD